GFAPKKKGRQTFFDTLAQTEGTVVLYEATHRIQKTIEEIATRQPDRPMLIARELTKKFETLLRGTAQELAVRLSSENTKGEFIVVVS
ncbi:rRNA (cytidine-2'-O-)-methyltransferase, partial [Candidatus Roizmanbacteria bacterium CG11_big_fil_rev_8_21_14_0_20_36_8]